MHTELDAEYAKVHIAATVWISYVLPKQDCPLPLPKGTCTANIIRKYGKDVLTRIPGTLEMSTRVRIANYRLDSNSVEVTEKTTCVSGPK